MNELNQSSPIEQIVNKIYEEMSVPDPYFPRVVDYLRDLRIKEEFQSLSNSEFYDIVGETFKLNPAIFMKHIYGDRRFYQYNRIEMQKYILEKFSLYEGEQILFEDSGKTIQEGGGVINTVSGRIYVTNYRIIAQGTLSTTRPTQDKSITLNANRKLRKSRDELIEGSTYQELPCYGYQFKTKNRQGLKKKSDGIKYTLNIEEDISQVSRSQQMKAAKGIRIILANPKEERNKFKINKLCEVLCRDTNQIMDRIRELLYMDLDQKRKEIEVSRLLSPKEYFPAKGKIVSKLQSEEVHHFSDSDYLYIVEETYKLDPEFFMSSIYPKMMSRKYSKYISEIDVKEEIKTLIDKLSEESGV